MQREQAPELVWLLEHPPLYTSGTSGKAADLLDARFPMFATGRGGQLTYHGPGQRVAYVMLDLKQRCPDVRAYVAGLEEWIIRALAAFNGGERREDRVGVWVGRPDKGAGFEDKIAAIGVRMQRWVSFHGIAINVAPDLTHFAAIVPCGVADPRYGVTSLADLGHPATMADVDIALRRAFEDVFGPRHACRKQRSEPRSGRWRLGAERIEAANEDVHRHGMIPVVIYPFRGKTRSLRGARIRGPGAQDAKRVHPCSRLSPALSNVRKATADSNSPSRRHSGESVIEFRKVAAEGRVARAKARIPAASREWLRFPSHRRFQLAAGIAIPGSL